MGADCTADPAGKVLSRLFRRLMLEMLLAAHDAGRLQFFGDHAHLADKTAFKAYLAPLHRTKWFVYSKWPFAGPEQVLAYLSRYTHRVAICNSRLIAADATGVTFRYKDYRRLPAAACFPASAGSRRSSGRAAIECRRLPPAVCTPHESTAPVEARLRARPATRVRQRPDTWGSCRLRQLL
jgi:hypothetical protein